MPHLTRGLYDLLLTEALYARLGELDVSIHQQLSALSPAEAPDRIALHLATVIERAIESLPDADRARVASALARRLIEEAATATGNDDLRRDRPIVPPQALRALLGRRPDGTPEEIELPLTPLLDTTLLTNSPGEPRVGRQLAAEIASVDRIDVVMAFIRLSGIRPLEPALRRHLDAGRPLRVLTTTYTGSTEPAALDLLERMGAQVRVSYDTGNTRLHAKAWLFHRDSGYSTAYIGSSNLTHQAQVTGLEWNVRVSRARNRTVIDKIAAVFDSYWEQREFEPYDRTRFASAVTRTDRAGGADELSPLEVRLEPFQERLLEQIALARAQGHHRNLLVSATGTGKTVMAAVDYARLRERLPRARLLFVAHREEIIDQSLRTFRHVLRDGAFGERWVGGARPSRFDHVFASIQSLAASGLASLAPDYFDIVIVDEFHHAAAASYRRLLDQLQPRELLGLTATPERADGLEILHWFDGRIAAELRLWDAIDQQRLTPFAYYGIADDLDLREVPFSRRTGYDVEGVTRIITATDVWARRVLKEFGDRVATTGTPRALGFCVSVAHARYMARVFNQFGTTAVAVSADTPGDERRAALVELAAGRVQVVFSVDLFNEGVDVPAVDAVLMLRPTESPVLFLQQLGRGLRRHPGKTLCTVLDFVGQHNREFRFDRRYQALLGGSRARLIEQIEQGFPYLPAGCHLELDAVASARVLDSVRRALPTNVAARAEELARLARETPTITLGGYLEATGLELDDVYANNGSWSALRERAGLPLLAPGPNEESLRRAIGRLLHVDDRDRLDQWRAGLAGDHPPAVTSLSVRERRLWQMLTAQLFANAEGVNAATTLTEGIARLWEHPQLRVELVALCDVLVERLAHLAPAMAILPDVPLRVHARYTRQEILAAFADHVQLQMPAWREGVRWERAARADLLLFTIDKTRGAFSPTTRYRDYAISRELIHWESQSTTRADSPTGRRYQQHVTEGSHILLFARATSDDRGFWFLGPARYVSHVREQPMAVTWRLEEPLPGDLLPVLAAAVA